MSNARSRLLSFQSQPLTVVLGTNEIASAVAVALTRAGYATVMSHDPDPPVIRRGMAFHDALFEDVAEVSGIVGQRAESLLEIAAVATQHDRVTVTPLSLIDLMAFRAADVLVDARMQKHRITPDFRRLARLTIGLGPKFAVGINCDIAIETKPEKAGAVMETGVTEDADGATRLLGGVGAERFVYVHKPGFWRTPVDIGMWVPKNFVIGRLNGLPIEAPIDGIIRGVARDETAMPAGVKLLEIDPRGRAACWTGTDERGRVIADAVLNAIRRRAARKAEETAAIHSGTEIQP